MGRMRQVSQLGRGTFINQDYGGEARGNTGAASSGSSGSGGGAPDDEEEEVDTTIIDTFESYPLGDVSDPSDLEGGNYLLDADVAPNLVAPVAVDTFEGYSVGAGPSSDLGVGFLTTDVEENYLGTKALEDFESYTVGAVTEGDLNQGTGWTGNPDIV